MSKRINTVTLGIGQAFLYVMDCSECGVVYGISEEMHQRRLDDGKSWCCPNGHWQAFVGKSPAEKRADEEKRRADRLHTQLLAEQDQRHAAERDAKMARASELRLKWRIGNGVCPCCNRTFKALADHVLSKHPEFVHQDFERLSVRMVETLAWIREQVEQSEDPVVDAYVLGINMNTVKALERRGLVEKIDYEHVALTETGWPLAEQALDYT